MILTMGLAAVVCGQVGCTTTTWPYGMSRGRHNFPSTPTAPKTITLVDTVTDRDLLIIDVPVGKTLVLNFERDKRWVGTPTGATPAKRVEWSIVDTGTRGTYGWQDAMALTGHPVLIKQEVRDPEPIGGAGVAQTAVADRPEAEPADDEPAVPIQRDRSTAPAKAESDSAPAAGGDGDEPASSSMGASDSPQEQTERTRSQGSSPSSPPTGEDLQEALD
jgi:hypothetical protein